MASPAAATISGTKNTLSINTAALPEAEIPAPAKFTDPDWTAKGEQRAKVWLTRLETLWINTGTLCNIECKNCYILSSPKNDALVYISALEAARFLDEAEAALTREIGFTGGEPFLNPEFPDMLEDALSRGFEVLVLTNAMQPMQRPRPRERLLDLKDRFANKLTMRVSLDHHTRQLHDEERGEGSFGKALEGISWLSENGFRLAIAGRTSLYECEDAGREAYRALISDNGWDVDADDVKQLVLFPEMTSAEETPEITTACWDILDIRPSEMMCATSRMVVKRRGADAPVVVPCTLLPFDEAFEMGPTLAAAALADGGMFERGAVKLCHRHCSKFCVLGGGSCS
ncbi:MAG: radical SAM protein [Alphaproteobacteria bacterium]|nr:radical SAM protein [Alphaproteobacteria bacterium]